MAHVHFHCSIGELLLANCSEADVETLTDVREHAALVVREMIASSTQEDWRSWSLHVSDDLGDEILTVPFSSMVGHVH